MALGKDFWWILGPSWGRGGTNFGEIVSGPGTPWEGDIGGGKNGSMD